MVGSLIGDSPMVLASFLQVLLQQEGEVVLDVDVSSISCVKLRGSLPAFVVEKETH
jgi:hypothetical protein